MSEKQKRATSLESIRSKKEIIVLVAPFAIATFIVLFNLVPQETLGYWADAYTVALYVTLLFLAILSIPSIMKIMRKL